MNWASKRKWTVLGIFAALIILIGAGSAFAIFYTAPTCTDHTQNGKETGIDCGGKCSTVCGVDAQASTVRFARALSQSGRQDLIAYIDNPNKDLYAKDAVLAADIYRTDGHMVHKRYAISLAAQGVTPLFIPGIAGSEIERVFVAFEDGSPVWTKGTGRSVAAPTVANIAVSSTGSGQRITANVYNQSAYVLRDTPLIASVFDANGSILAASQTVLPALPAQGTASVVFTWNEPFSAAVSRVDIIPLIALPQYLP